MIISVLPKSPRKKIGGDHRVGAIFVPRYRDPLAIRVRTQRPRRATYARRELARVIERRRVVS